MEKDDRAVAVEMMREGICTMSEIAALAGTSRQLVRYWCQVEDIDTMIYTRTRMTWLRKEWRRRMG